MRFLLWIEVKEMKDEIEAQTLLDQIEEYIKEVVGNIVESTSLLK